VFGRLVGAHHVENAVVNLLDTWVDEYLAQVERISSEEVNSIQRPRAVRVSSEQEKMPEDQTPALIVASPGLTDTPWTEGPDKYTARWDIEVGLVVSAKGITEYGSPRALRLARMYALAVRAIVVQQVDADGVLFRRDWIDERYDTLDSIDDRTICLSRVRFSIEVPDTLTRSDGPLEPGTGPFPEPAPDWPVAIDADIEVQKYPLTEDFDSEATPIETRRTYRRNDG
jgi:hypothetical protein